MGTFQTQTVWDRIGGGHRDVVLTKMIEGRARVLATIPPR
jgi:hypothetical protein